MSGSGDREDGQSESLKITCYYGITLPWYEITSVTEEVSQLGALSENLNVFSLLIHLIPARLDAHIEWNCCTCFVKISFRTFSVSLLSHSWHLPLWKDQLLDTQCVPQLRWEGASVSSFGTLQACCSWRTPQSRETKILLREHLQANMPR